MSVNPVYNLHRKFMKNIYFILGIEYTQFILKSINIVLYYYYYYYVVLNNNAIYICIYFVYNV